MLWALCVASLVFAGSVCGHMELISPPDLGGKFNPNNGGNIDYSNTSPLAGDGSNFPCKGRLNLLGTPQGKTVASWPAGSEQEMVIHGGTPHNGSSCQASLSLDKGKTWKVIHSWIGRCPLVQERSSFKFKVPSDTPTADEAVFAWTWFNKIGNREMYMGCSPVAITAGSGTETTSFDNRPDMFIANINSCRLQEMKSVKFPNPGPAVDTAETDALLPSDNCGNATATAAPKTQSEGGSGSIPKDPNRSGANSQSFSAQMPRESLVRGTAGRLGWPAPAGMPGTGSVFGPGENVSSDLNEVASTYKRCVFVIVAAQVLLTSIFWLFL